VIRRRAARHGLGVICRRAVRHGLGAIRRHTVRHGLCAAALLLWCGYAAAQTAETITIPADAPETPFPHVWEQMFGSGRAILALRESYRQDLRAVAAVTDFRLVRFHNILHDEVGILDQDHGRTHYNFSYVDQIYDGLLENGIRPFVEISFMPDALASRRSVVPFWYRPNRSAPASYARWDDLMRHFAAHLVERYGIDEVSGWYFEIWNEPNIDFWDGRPKQATYFTIYEHTARDLKAVDSRLRVGGPATAQAAWVGDFLRHMHEAHVPVDFVSSHVYANDTAHNVLGTRAAVPREDMVCRAVQKIHAEIVASPSPDLPFILSEFNASYLNEPAVTDSVYMGPWLATVISQCAAMTTLMSYWSFSDVFEEQGVVKTPFYGGYGLIAERGIPKPAYNAFALLHHLGARRIEVPSRSALVTRRGDGSLAIALWNYAPPEADSQAPPDASAPALIGAASSPSSPSSPPPPTLKTFKVLAAGVVSARLWRVDAEHGNVIKAYDAMDRPASPTLAQIETLKAAARMAPPEVLVPADVGFSVVIPPRGLALLELAGPTSP
jgi:xylan 1,4-beta-xylosidase